MIAWSRRLSWALLALLALLPPPLQADEPALQLQGRSSLGRSLALPDDSQLRWLWARRKLDLGVVPPDSPPFNLVGPSHEYEGITADYAGLLAEYLQLPVRVHAFDSLAEAIAALRDGRLDLLGGITALQAEQAGLRLSRGYAQDQPRVVVRDEGGIGCEADEPLRVAINEGYRSLEQVRARYPKAQLRVYSSTRQALGAVAFGQADLFIGGALESHYLIGRGQVSNLRLRRCPGWPAQPVGFAINPGDTTLGALLDTLLASVPQAEQEAIRKRWVPFVDHLVEHAPLRLTDAEQGWLRRHPVLRVMLDEQLLPLSYRDSDGRFKGLSVDVLQRVSRMTGLRFEFVAGGSVEQMIRQARQGRAEIIGALTPSSRREQLLSFTRAYLTSARVLITTAKERPLSELEELQGRRVAVLPNGIPEAYMREHYPAATLVESQGTLDAALKVANGRADAAILPLASVRSLSARLPSGSFRISASLPLPPAYFALAVPKGEPELLSILNKALASLSPQELDAMARRWQGEVIMEDNFWHRHRQQVLQGFAAIAIMLLLSLAWVRYLRRLVRVREQAERALADQLEFMRVMIDGTPHPLYVCDRNGRLLTCNSSYLETLGVCRDEVVGRPLGCLPHLAWQRGWREVLCSGKVQVEDRRVVLADGRERTFYHWMLPCRGGHAGASVIAGWIDVTERHQLQAALQRAKEEAEQANQAKTDFLAAMSHEIRTPLNAVLGMLELAVRKAEQGIFDRLSIEVASEAARGLLALIGDILDVTRIESGHLELKLEPVQLADHVRSVVQLFQQQAHVKGLQLELHFEGEVESQVMLDPLRFKQVLANLLSNAIKFTHEGCVQVRVSLAPCGARQMLGLVVEDTGIGIPEADLPRLGEPFWQACNHQQSARRGAGLGLSISRTLCDLMGGNMLLQSTLGVGTRIEIHLPVDGMARAPAPLADSQMPAPVESCTRTGLRVLVVDDYPANRLLLGNQLAYLGHQASMAEEGMQALRLWLQEGFDVVISDCSMPGMDGHALCRAIRLHERRHHLRPCTVLGITANAMVDERRRCLAAGMDDCLFKPLSLKTLAGVLDQVAGRPGLGDPAVTAHGSVADLSNLQRLAAGEPQAFSALLHDLLQSNRQDLEQLARHTDGNDLARLAELAHRIKGGARLIRATRLIEACEQVERSCAGQQVPLTRLQDQVDAVRLAMQALERELRTDPAARSTAGSRNRREANTGVDIQPGG